MPTSANADRKTLILTGASRGIGHATVKRFASAGWRVITCSRHAFPEGCPWEAGPEDHIQVDLSDPQDTTKAIGEMKQRLQEQGSRLNALVSNAAVSPKGENGPLRRSSSCCSCVLRPELIQQVGRVNQIASVESLRESLKCRLEKLERLCCLVSVGPKSGEADAAAQLEGEQFELPCQLK